MSTQPIDYDALAKQAGATSSIDYDALAKQAGAISSTAPTAPKITQTPTGTISKAPSGLLPWLNSVENDIRFGGQQTAPGKVLHFLGAPGINRGVPEETANQIAGPLIGPVTTAQGAAQIPQHPLAGILGMAKGLGETGFQAGGFMAPKAAEAATDLIPSAKYAGKLFEQAKAAAGDLPVDISGAGDAALRAHELAENGGKMPTLLNKFIRKSTSKGSPDIDYNAARDFYSNSGQQSIWQKLSTSPQMQRQIAQFRSSLGDAIQKTADDAGVGDVYKQALKEYHQAMVVNKLGRYAAYAATAKVIHDLFGSDVAGAVKGAVGAGAL